MSSPLVRRFVGMLELLNRGRFVEKCDEGLAKTLETLAALPGEKGKAAITVTIDVAYDSGRLDIRPAVKVKLPEDKAFAGTPFWEHEGALSIQHPSQIDMFSSPRDVTRERDAS